MRQPLNIVTASDSDYFHFLPNFIEQVDAVFPHTRIIVYDLGLTFSQLNTFVYNRAKFFPWRSLATDAKYPEGYYPRALHKPSMLLHATRSYPGNIVYMDVDAYPVSYFDVPDCDVAVTMKRRDQMAQHRGTELEEYLGKLDAGVIMFGPDSKRELFCAKWAMDMEQDPSPSDQKSLNRLVGECHDWEKYNVTRRLEIADDVLRVRILHEAEFNSSFMHPDAKIIHKRVHEQ